MSENVDMIDLSSEPSLFKKIVRREGKLVYAAQKLSFWGISTYRGLIK